MRPSSGSVRISRRVSARLRVCPLRASTPMISVFVGVPRRPPVGSSRAALAEGVIFSFESWTAPLIAM